MMQGTRTGDLDYGTLPDGRGIVSANIRVNFTFSFEADDGDKGSITGMVSADPSNIVGSMKATGKTSDAFPIPNVTVSGAQAKHMADMLKEFLDLVIQKGPEYKVVS